MNHFSAWNLAELRWKDEGRSPLLKISETDMSKGLDMLKKWSLPSNTWFVCLHVREGGDTNLRTSGANADITNYIRAIEFIKSRGGWVIRMGHLGMKSIGPLANFFDYANF